MNDDERAYIKFVLFLIVSMAFFLGLIQLANVKSEELILKTIMENLV